VLIRPCLDWSEQRPHIAGMVGAAICSHSLAEGWARRLQGTRAVVVTRKGERVFRERFGVGMVRFVSQNKILAIVPYLF
jgi:hypothetical protein